ncbi:MAG TPA: peptide ABC transporter ATP-binding protein [Actinobacteria bacterium]|nr:peptide ABC transporter ATP-binding protein [Actinomycetota bacterium]
MSAPLLSVRDLRVTFPSEAGAVPAVRGVDLEVGHGEVVGIVGESGSGKSTVALALMGLLHSSTRVEGQALLDGEPLLGLDDAALSKIRGKKVAMVFQDPLSAFTPVYTIGQQIAEAITVHQNISKSAAMTRATELLDLVGIPEPDKRVRNFPHEFSGGMRQRAMIAMAIANDPDLIIADEPTTALDVTVQAQILDVLDRARRESGAGLLLITHDLGIVAGTCDRVAVMYAGRIVESASADQLYADPRMPYTIGLLGAVPRLDARLGDPLVPIEGTPPAMTDLPTGCAFSPRCPLADEPCRDNEPALTTINGADHLAACVHSSDISNGTLSGEPVFALPDLGLRPRNQIHRESEPVVLDVEGLEREYPVRKGAVLPRRVGTVYAVDGVSFDVRHGEALALVGESGCGKTSTITEILELRAPKAGRVVILGHDTAEVGRNQSREIRRNVSVVFQDPVASLDPRLPIGDVLAEPLITHGMPREQRRERVLELMRLVGLDADQIDRYPSEFSGGQRQRIAIARALALEPQLIVLDEPVSALDVSIQAGILNLLADLRARLGLAYIIVSHDLAVVRQSADRVAVMYLGRIVEIGDTDRVFTEPWHPYTKALLSAVPVPDPQIERTRERILLSGDLPSPTVQHTGCRFASRCFLRATLPAEAAELCTQSDPALTSQGGSPSTESALTKGPKGYKAPHAAACFHVFSSAQGS